MTSTTLAQSADAVPGRSELQTILDEFVASGITGMTLRVRDESGEWTGAAGRSQIGADAKPPIDGHFRIGSNTKTFTATVVLQLVAEGKIGLDTPADRLPARVRAGPADHGADAAAAHQRVVQLHRRVLRRRDGRAGDPLRHAGKEWVDNRFTTYQPEELVRLALSKPARFEPGTDWSYSNTNYVLARLLIEKVTGRSFAEEMQRLILEPLGLSGTVVPDASTGDPRAARPRLLPVRGRRRGEDGRRHPPEPVLDLQRRRHDLDHRRTCTRSSPR